MLQNASAMKTHTDIHIHTTPANKKKSYKEKREE